MIIKDFISVIWALFLGGDISWAEAIPLCIAQQQWYLGHMHTHGTTGSNTPAPPPKKKILETRAMVGQCW